ncbi:restriction endonuclease subunit S [Leptospira interrogans serovar Szwajizak]|uniref:restriction endonuclease subunit S n=1 Tax=Leptospira interrogans TaxID=173 RepID=UPI0003483F71|nr:restriction endonuclease subunit S [Leptospira interrogans]
MDLALFCTRSFSFFTPYAELTLNIKPDDFFSIKFPIPSLPEQQKIADCLSSIDELISIQAQKLDALKSHKKGLLQQLFPEMRES